MMESSFSDSEFNKKESPIDELFKRVAESESSILLPEEEWSTENLAPKYSEINPKKDLYLKGLFDPGSEEICAKYIAISDSSILRHPYYNYPSILDPGIVEALTGPELKTIYPMNGQDLYLDLCKEMKIAPVRMFYNGLMDDEIDLSYYGVCSKSVRAMCLALTYNQTVKRIDFTSNFLNLDSCYHFGQLLAQNHLLQEIVLNECKIGKEGLRRIVVNLHFRNTDFLDLSSNDLGDDGFCVLMGAMFRGAIIKRLSVANNKLGHKSAIELDEILNTNNQFTHLDLSWNQFGLVFRAAEKLLRSLSESEYLIELNIGFNYISNAEALQLLMRRESIQHLDLSRNKLQSNTVKFIVNGFRRSKLKSLNLSRNPFTPQDAMTILQGFEKWSRAHQLYMKDIDVQSDFVELATNLQAKRNVTITYGRVVRDFVIAEVNMKDIIIKRFNVISRCKSKNKPKLDFCVYMLTLERKGILYINPKTVVRDLKEGYVAVDGDLIDGLLTTFPGALNNKGEKSIHIGAVCEYIRRLFPEKQPEPPTPEPEPELETQPGKKSRGAGAKIAKGKKK